jgi:hypothetical protein
VVAAAADVRPLALELVAEAVVAPAAVAEGQV